MKRGISTLEDVKALCIVDSATHCWLWQGGKTNKGFPTIHTFDHERGDKRSMAGPRAVWNIAHQEAPPAHRRMVYRSCTNKLCLNPAHLALAKDAAELARHAKASGRLKGTALDARRASIKLAQEARGIFPASPEIVRAVRAAPMGTSLSQLAAQFGLSKGALSNIRNGKSHKGIA